MGNESYPRVLAANGLVSRVSLLLQLATAVGSTWLLEQPGSSLIFGHDRLRQMLQSFANVSVRESCFNL